jgi:hypothetical protein
VGKLGFDAGADHGRFALQGALSGLYQNLLSELDLRGARVACKPLRACLGALAGGFELGSGDGCALELQID